VVLGAASDPVRGAVGDPAGVVGAQDSTVAEPPARLAEFVVVETPLLRLTFSNFGAVLVSAEVLQHESFTRDGAVQLISDVSTSTLSRWVMVAGDSVSLADRVFEMDPPGGFVLEEGDAPATFTAITRDAATGFEYRVEYELDPGSHTIQVRGSFQGIPNGAVFTDLGAGLAFNEHRDKDETQAMGFVSSHNVEGIESERFDKVDDVLATDGPFTWAATKSRYFVLAMVAGSGGEEVASTDHLGAVVARRLPGTDRANISVSEPIRSGGTFEHRLYIGPQDFKALGEFDNGLERVNSYGGKIFRPIVQPFVAIVLAVMIKLHEWTSLSYGWVLILIGVGMRILLFPLNQKAMRAQLRNMAVQPLLKEVQAKYKDQPEKLQKEMMVLYKEHGFNPLAGCLPMLVPWPVLISLFFVFQNTIELRGVEFLWMSDLSIPDPLYLLPVFLGLSMFAMQWVSHRSLDEPNPQMKMMMYVMPPFMVFLFLQFAAGLNLYYATTNLAMIPQQVWIANERKKAKKGGPPVKGDKKAAKAELGTKKRK
jgi:YidC/Oxa1 family membrane protein insertase